MLGPVRCWEPKHVHLLTLSIYLGRLCSLSAVFLSYTLQLCVQLKAALFQRDQRHLFFFFFKQVLPIVCRPFLPNCFIHETPGMKCWIAKHTSYENCSVTSMDCMMYSDKSRETRQAGDCFILQDIQCKFYPQRW